MFYIFLTALLTSVKAREIGMRALPGIKDSIINLGKMDVSFYLDGRPKESHKHYEESNFMKPCSCSHDVDDDFRFLDNLINSHSSYHQEPAFSTKCCKKDTHQDIIFAFTPKINPRSNFDSNIPFPLNLLMDSTKLKFPTMPKRNKAVEIVLFPKRKDVEPNVKPTRDIKISKKETKSVDEEKNLKKFDLPPVPLVQNNLDENTDGVKDATTKMKEEMIIKNHIL